MRFQSPRRPLFTLSRTLWLAWGLCLLAASGPLSGEGLNEASQRPAKPTLPLRFQHLSVEDGLSDSWVRNTIEDDRGFLWIATGDGLNRFDGRTFVHYRHIPGDAHSLGSSDVWGLLSDSRGRLWVLAGGLYLYDRDRDRFDLHPLDPPGRAPDHRCPCGL